MTKISMASIVNGKRYITNFVYDGRITSVKFDASITMLDILKSMLKQHKLMYADYSSIKEHIVLGRQITVVMDRKNSQLVIDDWTAPVKPNQTYYILLGYY